MYERLVYDDVRCAPSFLDMATPERAGIVAVERGDEIIARTVTRYSAARDFLYERSYVRWCFASSLERLEDGVRRLEKFLA